MHICFITNEYPKEGYPHGGIGSFVKTMSHLLVEKNHKVTVLGINEYKDEDERIKDGKVMVIRLKPKRVKGLTWHYNYKRLNEEINKIHLKTPLHVVETTELGLAFIKKIPSVKYVIRLHGGHHFFAEAEKRKVSWWKGFQEKRSFKKADGFIAVSEYVKSHTAKYLSYHNKPIEVIMSPIDLDVFRPMPEINSQPKTLVFAGTVCEKKGVFQLVKALPQVKERFKDIVLYVYGRDWFFKDGGSYISFLKKYISESQIDPTYIQFKGAVNTKVLAEKFAYAELCIFPSLMETQGLVAPEAMAMEKLVIFSNCGPGPETIEHKKTGLLCDPYDENDIAEKIIWALENREECAVIAKQGRRFVEDNFERNTLTKKNLNFYKNL
jgi:glycosyltransferase involved in cell wall biosynthesis